MDRDEIDGLVHSTGGLDKLADLLNAHREAGEQHIIDSKAGASHGGSSFVNLEELAGYQAPGEFDPNKFYKVAKANLPVPVTPPTQTPPMFNNIAGANTAAPTIALNPWRDAAVPATTNTTDLAARNVSAASVAVNANSNTAAATVAQHIGPGSFSSRIIGNASVSGLGNSGAGIMGGSQNAFGQILLSLEKIIDILGDINDKIDGLAGHSGKGGRGTRTRTQTGNPTSTNPLGGIMGALPAIIMAAIAAAKMGGPTVEGAFSGFGKWAGDLGKNGLKDLEDLKDKLFGDRKDADNDLHDARNARPGRGFFGKVGQDIGDFGEDTKTFLGRGMQDIGLASKGMFFKGARTLGNIGKWGGRLGLGISEAEDALHLATAHDAAGRANAGIHMGTDLAQYLGMSRGSALGGFGIGAAGTGIEDFADEEYINNDPSLSPEEKAQRIKATRDRSLKQLELNAGFSGAKWLGTKGIQLGSRFGSALLGRAANGMRSVAMSAALGDTAGLLEKIGGRAGPVAAAILGGVQIGSDLAHHNNKAAIHDFGGTTGAIAGGIAGAEGGAAVGAGIGAFFGGVGAVPGAAIGGVLGGIGGTIVGSGVGSRISDFVGDHWKDMQKGGASLLNAMAGLFSGGHQNAGGGNHHTVNITINNPVFKDLADKEDVTKMIKQQMAYAQQQHQNADTHGNGPLAAGILAAAPFFATI